MTAHEARSDAWLGMTPALDWQHVTRRHWPPERRTAMLWTIFVVMLLLWLLGMVTSYTLGGFIHILLVIAIAAVLIRLIQGRRAV
jgi:hypothetical protein